MDDSKLKMIASLQEEGNSLEDIAEIVGIPPEALFEVMGTEEYYRAYSDVSSNVPEMKERYTQEELLEWSEGMAPLAMEALNDLISSKRTSPAQRLKASEIVFNWQSALQAKKAEPEHKTIYHVYIDPEVAKRMDDLMAILESHELKQRVDTANAAVPNSTA